MIPRKRVQEVLTRDNHTCVLNLPGCTLTATTADHRANRGMGSSGVLNAFPVLIAACTLCNGAKEDAHGNNLERLIALGLRVLKAATNQQTIARCRNTPIWFLGSWWLLTDDGLRVPINAADAVELLVLIGARKVA